MDRSDDFTLALNLDVGEVVRFLIQLKRQGPPTIIEAHSAIAPIDRCGENFRLFIPDDVDKTLSITELVFVVFHQLPVFVELCERLRVLV